MISRLSTKRCISTVRDVPTGRYLKTWFISTPAAKIPRCAICMSLYLRTVSQKKIADFVSGLKNVTGVRVLPYHNLAGSKYASLGMKNTLPGTLPDSVEIEHVKALFKKC